MAKKGFMYKWLMGRDDQPDFTTARLPGTRWQVFRDILRMRLGALAKINILMLLFALPAIAWVLINLFIMTPMNLVAAPYSANLGIGYPAFDAARDIELVANVRSQLVFALGLIPTLVIAGIGLAGGFHVIKLLVWGEGITVGAHFFRGIRSNAVQYMLGMLLVGIVVFLAIMNVALIPLQRVPTFLSVLSSVSVLILIVLTLFFLMYYLTQAETYKLRFWQLIKNSFIFSIGMFVQNLLFVFLSLMPFLLLLIPYTLVMMIIIGVSIFLGLSYIVLIWTIYTQYVYDKFINDKVEGALKDRGVYRKRKDEEETAAKRLKAARMRKLSSIDEGKTFTPLSEGFSRADLARLAEEKKAVKEEIDEEMEAADGVYRRIMDEPSDEYGEPDDSVKSGDRNDKNGGKNDKNNKNGKNGGTKTVPGKSVDNGASGNSGKNKNGKGGVRHSYKKGGRGKK